MDWDYDINKEAHEIIIKEEWNEKEIPKSDQPTSAQAGKNFRDDSIPSVGQIDFDSVLDFNKDTTAADESMLLICSFCKRSYDTEVELHQHTCFVSSFKGDIFFF